MGRLIRPLLRVKDMKINPMQIDNNMNFELFSELNDIVEFVDTFEQQFALIAPKISNIYEEKKRNLIKIVKKKTYILDLPIILHTLNFIHVCI